MRNYTCNNEAIPPLQCLLSREMDSRIPLLMGLEAPRPFGHRSVMSPRVLLVKLPQLNGFLPEAKIDDNSDQECLIDNETDERETDNGDNDDDASHAPFQPNILVADLVEQQRASVELQERMIELHFHQNTKHRSRRESTSKNDKFDLTNPRH